MASTRLPALMLCFVLGGAACGEAHAPVDARPDPLDAGPTIDDAGPPPRLDAAVIVDASMPLDGGLPEADAGPSTPDEVERTFRVMHWNIAGGKENDCATGGITRAVRRFVRERDIDFVGLNEVCPAQYAAIRDALRAQWGLDPDARFAAFVGDETGRVVGNAIYARLPITGVTRHAVGEDRYGIRNLLCARVATLPHLRFCSTHLTPGDTAAARQLGRVMDRVEGWWADRRDTVILSGDLNLQADHPALDAVYASAVDTRNNRNNRGRYREVDDDDPAHCRGFGERTLPGTRGGPCREGGKIDFIFVRQNRIVSGNYDGDTLNIPADCTGVCSDHRPVIGRVRLRIQR